MQIWPKGKPIKGSKDWSDFTKAKMKESGAKAGRRPYTPEQRRNHRKAMKKFWFERHKRLKEEEEKLIENIE